MKIGSASCLEHFPTPLPEPLRDIDVLFFGMMNSEFLGVVDVLFSITATSACTKSAGAAASLECRRCEPSR